MKGKFKFLLITAAAIAAGSALAQNITVIVHHNPVDFQGQPPIMSGGRVLVPLRGVLERMGAHVNWDPASQTVSAHRDRTDVSLHIGENTASVNGHPVDLDVPAQIVNGSTMVPLRFVGEALGENVHWDSQSNTVDIEGGHDYDIPTPPPPPPPPNGPGPDRGGPDHGGPMVIPGGTVIPVSLDTDLGSDLNRRGDLFRATVVDTPQLPPGTKIEGIVKGARPQRGGDPGILEIFFTKIDFPDGHQVPILGGVIGLDNNSVARHGRFLIARPSVSHVNRGAFIGYGAGAGLIIGLANKRPIEDAAIGGLIGLGLGSVAVDRHHPNNVHLAQGTRVGVHMNQDVVLGR